MEENCVIVGLNENEVELELGLSIGGSFKRTEKLKPFKKDQTRNRTPDSGVSEKPQPLAAAEQEYDVAAADLKRKREIQAMRRQEAKKKREEKQQKLGLSSRDQKNRCRSRDSVEQPECKKTKVEFSGSSDGETKSANLNSGGAPNAMHNGDPNSAFCSVIPVQVPCPYPYPQVQYGFGNSYPCGTTGTLPCWSGVSGGNNRNAGQQAANQGFRPFKGSQNSGNGFDSDPNSSCTRDERNRKSGSNGSAVCSSPLLSDLQSSSNQGGSSNDIGPNSSNGCQPDHPVPTTRPITGPKCQLEETATSHQTDYSTPSTNDSSTKPNDHHTEAVSADNSNSKEEPAAAPHEHKAPLIVKDDGNVVDSENKPPPPPPPSSLPYMPCVSTTGDGPNGRTVNGFLYRYSQTEVSIVCVCHGSSFSPAEFVKHAGGTAVLQPLRHITVIPSAF